MKSIELWINEKIGIQTSQLAGQAVRRFAGRSSKGHLWPVCSELQNDVEPPQMIGVTSNPNQVEILRLLGMAMEWSEEITAGIVYCCEVVPADLLTSIPTVLHRLLRIPQPVDLICVDHDCLADKTAEMSVIEAVLMAQTVVAITADGANKGVPEIDRFPQPGPGESIVRFKQLQESVLRALKQLRLPTMEQRCVEAGILLLWDFSDASHEISQTMEGKGTPRTADYWHGIIHRREPDAGNASYWFRRVGQHPAFDELSDHLLSWMTEIGATGEQQEMVRQKILRQQKFDPFAMIELSQQAIRAPGHDADVACRMVQYLEILNLLAWSCRSADLG